VPVQARYRYSPIQWHVHVRSVRQRCRLALTNSREPRAREINKLQSGVPTLTRRGGYDKDVTAYPNIPIWSTMCSQLPGVFNSSVSNRWSSTLILIILSAISFTFLFHSAKSSGSLRINETCHNPTVQGHITH